MPRKKAAKSKENASLDNNEEEETQADNEASAEEENDQAEAVAESGDGNEENNVEGDANSAANDETVADDEDENVEDDGPSTSNRAKKTKKRKKRAAKKGATKNKKKKNDTGEENGEDEEDEEEVYEVQKILDVKVSGNKRQFLIRWKNYSAKNDTWEPEENLSCNQLIEEFMSKHNDDKDKDKNARKKQKRATGAAASASAKSGSDEEDYEVEKVVGVEMVGRKRKFKIRWKNFSPSHDTWEPEENLSCDEMIESFLKGSEKDVGNRKLRTNRKAPKKFVASAGLRESKRTRGKERDYAENETDE